MAASIIQADLAAGKAAIRIKLADLSWIDGNYMGSHISGETLDICRSTLDQPRHMAIGAANI